MGRMLGAFADDSELDRPDLNKCPDCGCYFKQDTCPLCGKVCPEEMRAGNRKPVKPPKRKRSNPNARVTFVEWYHSWWVILLALIIFPIVGIVLLFTSPHKKSLKILLAAIAILYTVLISSGLGWMLLDSFFDEETEWVDTSLSREEYQTKCDSIDPETYYRAVSTYVDRFVTMELLVEQRIVVESVDLYDETGVYYLCTDAENPEIQILIRDCSVDEVRNYLSGDVIRIWGEGAGEITAYESYEQTYTAPGVYVAYLSLVDSGQD